MSQHTSILKSVPSSSAVTEQLGGKSLPILSLFCGAGGLDLGFSQAGFKTILAYDINGAAVRTFNRNMSPTARVADLSKMTAREIVKDLHGKERVVGVIGGPPCQGFSRGNVSRKPNDPRNRLPYSYARIVGALRTKFDIAFFVFENVPGLLTRKMSRRWSRIKTAFDRQGFDVRVHEANAADYGVPQKRRRLFLIGISKDAHPDNVFLFPKPIGRPVTIADAIRGLPKPAYFDRTHGICASEHHPNHWTMQPKSERFKTRLFNQWRSFRRLKWGEPSPTVAYGNREIHVHPNGRRRLSVYEAMLLQGFPGDFEMMGCFSEQITQVCNAVPPPMAYAVANALRMCLFCGVPDATQGFKAPA